MLDLAQGLADYWGIAAHRDIVEWAAEAIDFSDDVSAERSRLDFDLSPFLIDPLRAWDFGGRIREVTVCGIEQHGKTLLEAIGVIYSMIDKPCSMLCIYPSDDDAADINRTKYVPLIRKIPSLAAELDRPFSSKKDAYLLGGATMFFQGAGKKIMSKSCKIVVLDEEDHYPTVGTLIAHEDARKRTRSYSESLLYRVCTPTTDDGPIWQAFLAGSQGYWTLRCLGCGKLTIRSCDLHHLQFESTYDETRKMYTVVPGSCRLICPECRREHTEKDKREMNLRGSYVHRFRDRLDARPSYQFGALASQFAVMSWDRIAAKILECGKRADIKAHYELDNSFRGLPYRPREIAMEDIQQIKSHFYHDLPTSDRIEMVFVVSDTQDLFSPTGVFALDCADNLWLIRYGNVPYLWLAPDERAEIERRNGEKVETVDDLFAAPVRFSDGVSVRPLIHVIDYRGHRQREIEAFAATRRHVIMYAGTSLQRDGGGGWRQSAKNPRMILADARHWQRVLIWHLYSQRNRETCYLYLPEALDRKYQAEITCVQPDKTRRSGHLPENWAPHGDAVHDAFDVLKMAYFACDWALNSLHRERFRVGQSPALLRRWRAVDERRASSKSVSGGIHLDS